MRKRLKIFIIFLTILPLLSLLGFLIPARAQDTKGEQIGLLPGIVNGLVELAAGPPQTLTPTPPGGSVSTPDGRVAGEHDTANCGAGKSAGEAYLIVTCGYDDTLSNAGAIGVVGKLIDGLYSAKPASGVVYAQQRLGLFKSNITGEVYAKDDSAYFPGLGFNILSAFQNLWAWARNISYGLFILIFLGIAFQILFRSKLDGQTPVTLANSIPNAIIALALVSLSYAITGLSIDMITLGTNIVKNVISTAPASGQATGDDEIKPLNPDRFSMSVWGVFNYATQGQSGEKINDAAGAISAEGSLGGMTKYIAAFAESWVGGSLIQLVFVMAALSAGLKLFFGLLRKYLVLLFNIVVAPFVFLMGATPGGLNKVILPFIRGIFATSATFIIVYAMFAFMVFFMNDSTGNISYVPPLLGFKAEGDSAGIPIDAIKALSAFGIFVTTPLIPDYVQKWFNAPDLSEILENITQTGLAGGQRLLQFGGLGFQLGQGILGTAGRKE